MKKADGGGIEMKIIKYRLNVSSEHTRNEENVYCTCEEIKL